MVEPRFRRSLLMRLAWRQSLLRLVLLYSVAIAIGWWSGQMAWVLLVATALVAARGYWRLFRVLWDPLESTCRHASLSIL